MLTVQLLGGFKLTYEGEPIPGLTRPRGKSLLAYLLLHHATPQDRTHLAYTFWPETSDSQARTNLRRELHQLRQSFPLFTMLSQRDGQSVQWQMPDDGALDVTEFTRLLAAAEQTTDPVTRKTKYQAAIGYYQGDLLPGLYDDWVLVKREELRQAFIRALETLTTLLIDDREYAAATTLTQRLLQYDPLYEAGYVQLMELYALQNDRARALHTYHSCATILERELGVPTSTELDAIYQRLLHADDHPIGDRHVRDRHVSSSTTFHLVGRKPEWQTLLGTWRQASQDRAQLLLIEGEAGIGKTRLAEELLEWANRQAIPTARTRSYAAEGALAYAPVIEWLRSPALRTAVATLDPVWRTDIARLLPELLTEFPDLPHPEPLAERWQRQRLFEALARAMTVDARPKLLLIDDLQWCDQETLEWLRFLLRFAPDASLLLLGTVRTEEVTQEHPLQAFTRELHLNQQLTTIEVTPLNATETAELAAQVSDAQLDSAAADHLVQASEGNPLFIVEMAQSEGWTAPTAGAQPLIGDPQMLPPKVYAVIQHRLAQLSSAARILAALAATIGRSFTFDLLCAAAEQGEDEVVNGLDELWRRKVIHERGTGEYDFSHDRIREAAYAELSPMRRKQLHRQVAQALETVYTNDTDFVCGQLALHYEQAGQFVQAIHWYQRAGQVTWNLHAYHDVVHYRRSAINLCARLPITKENQRYELRLQLELIESLTPLTGFTHPERLSTIHRAKALALELHDMDMLADVLSRLWITYVATGNAKQLQLCVAEAHSLLDQIENPHRKVHIYIICAGAARYLGNVEESKRMYMTVLQCWEIAYQSTPELAIHMEQITACMNLAVTLWMSGYPERALDLVHPNCLNRDRLKDPVRRSNMMFLSSILFRNLGDDTTLNREAEQMFQLGTQYDIAFARQSGSVFCGWLLAKQGQLAEGIALTSQGVDGFRRMGHSMFQTHRLAMLVEMLLWAEEYAQADKLLQEAFDISEHRGERFWDVELYRLRGDLLLAQRAPDEQAEAAYLQAIEVAQQQGAKSLELRATTALCQLWQHQGQTDQAYQALVDIYGWFTEGFDTHDLRAALALLTELRA